MWNRLVHTSSHILALFYSSRNRPELDGIAACQCTSPATLCRLCRSQIPRLHTKQRVDLVTHGARYSAVRRACSCSHGQCNQSGRISVSANISNSHSPSDNVATPDTLAAKTSTWMLFWKAMNGHGRFRYGISPLGNRWSNPRSKPSAPK